MCLTHILLQNALKVTIEGTIGAQKNIIKWLTVKRNAYKQATNVIYSFPHFAALTYTDCHNDFPYKKTVRNEIGFRKILETKRDTKACQLLSRVVEDSRILQNNN